MFIIGANSTAFLTEDNDLIVDEKFMISIYKDEETGEYCVSVFNVEGDLTRRACDMTSIKNGEIIFKPKGDSHEQH